MRSNVFTYGTLQFPAIMAAVTGQHFARTEAVLKDYQRFTIKGECFPGIISRPGGRVRGCVYHDVDALALRLLDRFEGEGYERIGARIETAQGPGLPAQVYVIPRSQRFRLSATAWDPEVFQECHAGRYLAACRCFHRHAIEPAPG